jgi:hypothetical protein
MAKPFTVCALCISAGIAGGVGYYLGATIEQGVVGLPPHLQQAVTPKAAIAAPADANVEVLRDRVRCDVRYQELKISPDNYQSFKRKCMGEKYDGD